MRYEIHERRKDQGSLGYPKRVYNGSIYRLFVGNKSDSNYKFKIQKWIKYETNWRNFDACRGSGGAWEAPKCQLGAREAPLWLEFRPKLQRSVWYFFLFRFHILDSPTTSIINAKVAFNLQLLDLNLKDLFPGKIKQDTQSSIIQIQKIDK